jgi:ABC-type multidrug transport system ATPase subunit
MSSGEHSDSVLTGQQTVSPTELTRTNWENEGSGFELAWSLLSVEHKEKAFLENATGRAKPGQLTAIMGHSGSGKTTLLKALTGRGLVTSGKVLLNGTQVNPSCPWFQKAVPFVADRETLEATATTIEVITFSASLRLSSDTAQEKIEMLVSDIIVQLKLEACAQTQCRHLSAGERRRLSVAVELVVGPKTLVLDEPTSGLDR